MERYLDCPRRLACPDLIDRVVRLYRAESGSDASYGPDP